MTKKTGLVLTISGDTVDEIKEKLVILTKQFGGNVETAAVAKVETRGRKKKEEEAPLANGNGHLNGNGANGHAPVATSAPANEDIFETAPVAAVAATTKAPTREDVQRAVIAVQTAKGLPTAREVLMKFGAKRFAELQEKDFVGMIQACTAALK